MSAEPGLDHARRQLLSVYHAALGAVHGAECVRAALAQGVPPGPVCAAAVGKAACAMMAGARAALGARVRSALVITRRGYRDAGLCGLPGVRCLEAGHPVPDAHSLAAGEALLAFAGAVPPGHWPLLLVSGGASSLAECPVAGIDAAGLARVNRWLLGSGLDIRAMNRVRCAISTIKGGRLARHLAARPALALLISDVRGEDPAVIGSGLVAPSACDGPLPAALPAWLRPLLDRAPAAPARDDPVWAGWEVRVVARLTDALDAAAAAARALPEPVHRHPQFVAGDPAAAGAHLARQLRAGPPGIHLWGGEPTPTLPPHPGRGGRCQALALATALELDGVRGMLMLAGASDGSDGPGQDAGALVDGGTVARGRARGFDPARCLAGADAGSFLQASGDLLRTGPTGTNVMDLFIGWKAPGPE